MWMWNANRFSRAGRFALSKRALLVTFSNLTFYLRARESNSGVISEHALEPGARLRSCAHSHLLSCAGSSLLAQPATPLSCPTFAHMRAPLTKPTRMDPSYYLS